MSVVSLKISSCLAIVTLCHFILAGCSAEQTVQGQYKELSGCYFYIDIDFSREYSKEEKFEFTFQMANFVVDMYKRESKYFPFRNIDLNLFYGDFVRVQLSEPCDENLVYLQKLHTGLAEKNFSDMEFDIQFPRSVSKKRFRNADFRNPDSVVPQ